MANILGSIASHIQANVQRGGVDLVPNVTLFTYIDSPPGSEGVVNRAMFVVQGQDPEPPERVMGNIARYRKSPVRVLVRGDALLETQRAASDVYDAMKTRPAWSVQIHFSASEPLYLGRMRGAPEDSHDFAVDFTVEWDDEQPPA